jgi:hypothetical protein
MLWWMPASFDNVVNQVKHGTDTYSRQQFLCYQRRKPLNFIIIWPCNTFHLTVSCNINLEQAGYSLLCMESPSQYFTMYLHIGEQIVHKSRSHLKIPNARRVTQIKSYNVDARILGNTIWNFVTTGARHLGFQHPYIHYSSITWQG